MKLLRLYNITITTVRKTLRSLWQVYIVYSRHSLLLQRYTNFTDVFQTDEHIADNNIPEAEAHLQYITLNL
jgi:hypothetical protein